MKSMQTLMRLKQREIDALKRSQATMEEHREMMHDALNKLSQALVAEFKAAEKLPDMAQFYGGFSSQIKKRQEQIHVQLRKLEFELNKVTEQIRDRFSELKKYELALKAHQKREADKARRAEQQEMDEIAIRGYIRRHAQQ